jgi:methanogenic corrinoid protein MtbC1
MLEELYKKMAQSVIEGDTDAAAALAQQALNQGVDPLEAINKGFTVGMDVVGELYSSGEYFLPDLILGGEAMKASLAVLEPALRAESAWQGCAGNGEGRHPRDRQSARGVDARGPWI